MEGVGLKGDDVREGEREELEECAWYVLKGVNGSRGGGGQGGAGRPDAIMNWSTLDRTVKLKNRNYFMWRS